MTLAPDAIARLEAKVSKGGPGECWDWSASVDGKGRPKLKIGGRLWIAARLSYQVFKGPIPAGAVVRHTCDNERCCNPDHLLTGSQGDNIRDRDARGRTQQGEGHYRAKLTTAAVTAMRQSTKTNAELAAEFGVSVRTAARARRGDTWKGGQDFPHHPKKKAA